VARYAPESKERVRDAVDFVEVVSAKTELRRAGVNRYEGLCPFHDERTPSFGIDPTNKLYHCFGCQAGGDVFDFVRETEGVDFPAALELLADRYGVELEREAEDPRDAARRRRRERLLELLSRTAGYYERVLWEAPEAARAREYLVGRGLAEEMLREFRVGYAPSAWDRVLTASRRAGYSEEELLAAGLSQRSREAGRRPYDRFRERIMFPLADTRGRVMGFGARAMRDNQGAKYINTADGDVYHKGRHLYGADLARSPAAKAGQVIVCEGYTDVIALHQAGLRHTVGLMGTALTAEQVSALAALVGIGGVVLLALDADSAGQQAMLRAAQLAGRARLELRVVPLAVGTDPADMVHAQGAEAMQAVVERSVPFVRFRVERVLALGDHDNPEGRDRMIDELRPVFSGVAPGAMREELLRMVSGRLGLKEGLTESLLAQPAQSAARGDGAGSAPRRDAGDGEGRNAGRPANGGDPARAKRPAAAPLDRRAETERAFLALCMALPDQGRQALAEVDVEEHFTSDVVRRAARHLRDHLASPGEGLPDDDAQLASLIAELAVRAGRQEVRAATLEVESLQLELARIDRRIQGARAEGKGDVAKLAEQRDAVRRAVDQAYEKALEGGGG
jgi:DNA primase